MKKLIALLLALAMCLSLAACGGNTASGDAAPTEEAAPAEDAPAEVAAPADSVAGEYTYTESLPFGQVPWILTLAEDSTYSLTVTKPNGAEFTYTGTYTADGNAVTTGTPAEDTTSIEADFFSDDFSCDWNLNGDGTMVPANEGQGGGMPDLDEMDFGDISLQGNVEPAEAVGNTYIYEETNEEFGFTTKWELTFTSESECTLFEPNDMMGDTTYHCTYTFADGQYTVTIAESSSGKMPMSPMFDENNSCVFAVWGDGDFKPANGGNDMGGGFPGGGMPGMMGGSSEGSENADFRAVSYASNSASQVRDIYLPENATGSDPVIVVVHGGGFKFGDQTMEIIRPVIEAGQKNGYVVASVDYRKSGEATFPGALSDVKAAVRFLRANAAEYGIDPEKVVIWGESAGAYLADMTALTPNVAELNGGVADNADYPSAVSAMVSFYAPIEFYTMDEEFIALGNEASANHSVGSFETDYLGIPDMTADQDGVYQSWWGTYADQVPAGLYAWIQAGRADTSVPYTQSQNLADGLTEAGVNVKFSLIEGAAHEDAQFYTEENLAGIFAFLSEALG